MLLFVKKLFALFLLFICWVHPDEAPEQNSGKDKHTVNAGAYSFQLPGGYTCNKARGSDGKAGCLQSDSLLIYYGCGSFAHTMPGTMHDYFSSENWYGYALNHIISQGLFKEGARPHIELIRYYPDSTATASTRQYNLVCLYKDHVFEIQVPLPETATRYVLHADTLDQLRYKTVFPAGDNEGMAGVWIQSIHSENQHNEALSFVIPGIKPGQKNTLLQLVQSVRFNQAHL